MAYTVGEVSRLTRVSVRALHHYDEIGLVRPSGRTASGYRQYEDRDLDRLHQVLLYRELGLKLDDIAAILDDPTFDRRKALIAQREQLARELDRKRAVLAMVERSIRALDGGYVMTKEEQFEVFGEFDVEKHEEEARQRWGDTAAFKESTRRAKQYSKEDWQTIKAEGEAIVEAFARAMDAGTPAADAADVAEQHRQHISRWFYPCSKELHAKLGRMYVDDSRFAATYESKRAGLAEYVRDTTLANALRSSD